MRDRSAPTGWAAALRIVLPTAVFFLYAVAAQSSPVTYQYTGSLYSWANGPFDTSMRIEGTVTFASPLPTNAPLQDFSSMVTSHDFTDGVHFYTYAPLEPPFYDPIYYLETDSAGSVVAWSVIGNAYTASGTWSFSINSAPSHPSYPPYPVFDGIAFADDSIGVCARSASPGTLALVPEPSVLTLYGFGLIALAMTRRRTGAGTRSIAF